MQQTIDDLEQKFKLLGWHGTESFTRAVATWRYEERSFAYMCREYLRRYPSEAGKIKVPASSGRELYTIRCYLSDFFSRRNLMSAEEVSRVDGMFARLATEIQPGHFRF